MQLAVQGLFQVIPTVLLVISIMQWINLFRIGILFVEDETIGDSFVYLGSTIIVAILTVLATMVFLESFYWMIFFE